jgi:hypothetical protein
MLPTTGLVGGCGIGSSLFFVAIVDFVPCLLLVIARSEATKQSRTVCAVRVLECFASLAMTWRELSEIIQTAFYAIRSAWH